MTNEETPTNTPPVGELIPPEEAIGMRLDTWLSRLPGAPSRNRVQQLVKDGNVLINGAPPKRVYTIEGNETITVDWPPPDDDWPWPQNIPLDIVHHDDDVIVVNKQAGLVVHPSAGNPDGTLVNALLHLFPDLPGINGTRRPGIVHRIDRNTTGLLVVAKNDRAMKSLANQLIKRTVKRQYLAIILGDPQWSETTVDAAVGMDPANRLHRKIDGPHARNARSHFAVLRRTGQFTLIGCRLETGRTHQIRIHCKHIGHPIICDSAYDGHLNRCLERLRPDQHALKKALVNYDRPWLHAHTLSFFHPTLQKTVHFQTPPPGDSRALMENLFGEVAEAISGERIVDL
ncbi:MAG: RluA family pseudouridine synthase [Candidatus Sumerlaeia bacterium]|nr:RluA family pseudouridine synthase [Candidatus Sumerlaeia bacterium]